MADATFDVVIAGGGNKALSLAMYLTKYGKMTVGIIERRHELGGGWASEELIAPGFVSNPHAHQLRLATHLLPLYEDFDFEAKGCRMVVDRMGPSAIFKEDHSCVGIYSRDLDPTGERTAREFARFSPRDAETWLNMSEKAVKLWEPAALEYLYNPPTPPGVPDAFERLFRDPASGLDPRWVVMSPLEVSKEMFESGEVRKPMLRVVQAGGIEPDMYGMGLMYVFSFMWQMTQGMGGVVGGTHNAAHAAQRVVAENGGKFFTRSEVDNIIIENSRARGVRLLDGTEIQAKKAVVSTVDPRQLCFRFIGKKYLSPTIVRKIENMVFLRGITWYTWAFHEAPRYKANAFNPDIDYASHVWMTNKDMDSLSKYDAGKRLGLFPPIAGEFCLWASTRSLNDPTQAPNGKTVVLTETYVPPASSLTEKEWMEYHRKHAERELEWWHEYAPNVTWDNVIGYNPETPYTTSKRLLNMSTGCPSVIDNVPSQIGRNRPIPELAQFKVPGIGSLYCTGSAWHPYGYATCAQAYNCYKVMAQDFGLEKPWEQKGRPW